MSDRGGMPIGGVGVHVSSAFFLETPRLKRTGLESESKF